MTATRTETQAQIRHWDRQIRLSNTRGLVDDLIWLQSMTFLTKVREERLLMTRAELASRGVKLP